MQPSRKEIMVGTAAVALALLVPDCAVAGDIDTEHIFGFMIGSDIGSVGEREFQTQTTGRFGKARGRFNVGEQEFEVEWVPAKDIRIEVGTNFAAHQIAGVPGLVDSRGFALQGMSIDMRYRLLDREAAPLGMTLAVEGEFSRLDEVSIAPVRGVGTGLTLAFDRDLIPGKAVVALNLTYQPEWTRHLRDQRMERDATVGASLGVMVQARAGVLLGGELRYMRRYEGIGFDDLAGQAMFVGPTAYFQLSDRSRLTASWSAQVWGRSGEFGRARDLVNFERQQVRLVYGVNF